MAKYSANESLVNIPTSGPHFGKIGHFDPGKSEKLKYLFVSNTALWVLKLFGMNHDHEYVVTFSIGGRKRH